jgi:hypothetical protein
MLVLERAALERREQRVEVGEQDVRRALQLHRQRGVEHVGAGHALVHEAALLVAHLLGDPGEEGDHVMLGHRLDRVDRGDVDGVDTPTLNLFPAEAALATEDNLNQRCILSKPRR